MLLLAGIGTLTSVLLFSFSGAVARAVGNPNAVYSILAIAPGLFFVSVISSFRGYFQGMQYINPTAISQVIEQMGKLDIGAEAGFILGETGVEFGAAGCYVGRNAWPK